MSPTPDDLSTSTHMESSVTSPTKPPSTTARPKSPPLAFEKTPNDMLIAAPLSSLRTILPNHSNGSAAHSSSANITSPSSISTIMGRLSPSGNVASEHHLQVIVDQQSNAISLLHEAFAAERQVWSLEKERLYQRIANLEQLLKNGDHYSPAKSPVISPTSWANSGLVSPQPRSIAISNNVLPTITEDEKTPLSARRTGAPQSIDLSPTTLPDSSRRSSAPPSSHHNHDNNVAFTSSSTSGVQVEEIPASPARLEVLSPPPLAHRILAGHTPIRVPHRKPTPPPAKMSLTGIEDTPTRNNTHINAYLTRTNDDDMDRELRGPLNLPELPSNPEAGEDGQNFTLEALSKRLEQIERDPERDGKPMIFSTPSPGLMLGSPIGNDEADGGDSGHRESETISPRNLTRSAENPLAPLSTAVTGTGAAGVLSPTSQHQQQQQSHPSSTSAMSPNGAPLTPLDLAETQHFEQGGIKLKKKTSVNFGAPLGQLVGVSALRKLS